MLFKVRFTDTFTRCYIAPRRIDVRLFDLGTRNFRNRLLHIRGIASLEINANQIVFTAFGIRQIDAVRKPNVIQGNK